MSDGQLWRYIGRADRLIAESCRASTKKLLRRHLAQRRNLFAKAVSAGDLRTALAAAQDEARLLNLYPSGRLELTGKAGGPMRHDHRHRDLTGLSEDELRRQYQEEIGEAPGNPGRGP